MEDDFNTADAVSAIFELVKLANSTADASSTKSYVSCLLKEIEQLCDVLGIITERKTEVLDSEIEEMIAARQQARKTETLLLQMRSEENFWIWVLFWKIPERA